MEKGIDTYSICSNGSHYYMVIRKKVFKDGINTLQMLPIRISKKLWKNRLIMFWVKIKIRLRLI